MFAATLCLRMTAASILSVQMSAHFRVIVLQAEMGIRPNVDAMMGFMETIVRWKWLTQALAGSSNSVSGK